MKRCFEKILGFNCFYLWSIVLFVLNTFYYKAYSQSDFKKINYKNSLYFIENKGQWHEDVYFLHKAPGMDVWITKYGLNLTLYKLNKNNESTPKTEFLKHDELFFESNTSKDIHRIIIRFENLNNFSCIEGKDKLLYHHNYFKNNDKKKFATHVSLYREAIVKNIYDGIDIRYYFDNGALRYDFIVHPYADISQIKFKVHGDLGLEINQLNQLFINTLFGKLLIKDLKTFQSDKLISSQFIKNNDCWQIKVGNYDKSKTLIIDPIIYSTFIGGSLTDISQSMVVDSLGNMYITGYTNSLDYDTTSGVIQNYYAGTHDVFCTKLNSSGSDLIFSTYIGGYKNEYGNDISLDKFGYIYITGSTTSSDFIITPGAFQTSISTNEADCFITKISPLGDSIIYSTYLGGERYDEGIRIKTDDEGNAYVAGITYSWQFDITPGAFQINGGYPFTQAGYDLFITKLNPTGTGLIYSTYLGVYGVPDYFADIELDNNNCVYVLGSTVAYNFYTTPGAYQTSIAVYNGLRDAFVFKLNKTGTGCVYSTYFGGNKEDFTNDLAIDKDGNIYILGTTNSDVFPTTPGAINEPDNNYTQIYIAKLDSSLSTLKACAKFGSNVIDHVSSIQVDSSANIWILGNTMASNYPVTNSAIQSSHHGSHDIFLTQLNPDASRITYSTFIGGSITDVSTKMIYEKENTFYILGNSYSPNFPLTDSAYQNYSGGGGFDVVALKVCVSPFNLLSTDDYENQNICLYSPIQSIIYETQGASNITVDGLPAGVNVEIINDSIILSGVPMESGYFTYTLTITNSCEVLERSGNINIYDCSASIEDETNDIVKIYPNPSNGILFIEGSMDDSFELYDAMGRLIDKFKLTDLTLTLQLNNSSGVYFIKSNNYNKVYKIVLNH